MNNLAQTKDALAALAQQFRSYNYKSLNESQVRKSYIDEFWNILGWNTADIRQVQVETRDRNNKKPDYRFLVQNKTAFFVEAKKPSEDLMKNSEHIFQAKSYCWSGNVPLVVLTDFEEFRPFKCVNQPDKNKPKDGIIKQLDMTFEQYADRAEELLLHFGYESVVGGSLAQLLQLAKVKDQDRVDRVFLKQLAEWRKVLAEKAALVNTFHSSNELAEAVQRILDRLVFLRILQDRSIEDQNHLRTIADTKKHAYKTFVELCQGFSHTYNGLIFNPHPLSESITIPDLDFKPIVQELLPDESPYRFDEIPVEVLGTIYERFLGDEIILQGRSAIVETKPDVRKAGGVYYTPQYIVEYIVNNTVGTLLAQCNHPKEVAALTICDPACGSGSFLLGAFDALIAWHEQYYEQHPDEWKEKSGKSFIELAFRDSYNKVRLTAEQKGRIAKNNLYGVDLDRQATEVTQMSLYIKILESIAEEPSITISYRNAILPKLSDNIKHGNSLVDVDYYDMFPAEEHNTIQEQVHPFHWKYAFPHVFKQGGFDAVIGNPPYVRSQSIDETIKKYLVNNYETSSYQPDAFSFFIEKGIKLLKTESVFGYIIPNGILTNTYYEKLRDFLLKKTSITTILNLKSGVFDGAAVDTSIIVARRPYTYNNTIKVKEFQGTNKDRIDNNYRLINQESIDSLHGKVFNTGLDNELTDLINKIGNKGKKLGEYCEIKAGMKVRKDFVSSIKKNEKYKKFILGSSVKPYFINYKNEWVCYDKELESKFTNQAFRDERIFLTKEKILIRQVMGKERIYATIDTEQHYTDQSIYNLLLNGKEISIEFILMLLVSKLMYFYFSNTAADRKETFPKIKGIQLLNFPIASPNSNMINKAISLVETMLELHKTKQGAVGGQLEQIEQRISFTDEKINRLVYELYELTEEEIRIVEGV